MRTEAAGFLNIGDDDDGEIMIPYPHTKTVVDYEFQNRPGDGVLDLSGRYLALLNTFIEDGIARAWITG